MKLLLRSATRTDLPAIEALLRSVQLTTSGVADHVREFLVGEDGGTLVATGGLELYGDAALLRSVAVLPPYRDAGEGRRVIAHLLARAREAGVHDVYLLTTTAAGYFGRLGFAPLDREAVRAEVRQSAEFGDAACATAQAMWLALAGDSQLEEG